MTQVELPTERFPPAGRAVDSHMLSSMLVSQYEPFHNADEVAGRLLKLVSEAEEPAVSKPPPGQAKTVTSAALEHFLARRNTDLRTIFAKIDTDKDHFINYDDIVSYFDRNKLDYDGEKVELLCQALDRHGSGRISASDFTHQLLLVPTMATGAQTVLQDAYAFFADDLQLVSLDDEAEHVGTGRGIGYFWAGGFAGVVSRSSTAPFDRLKVYLIAASAGEPGGISIITAIQNIYRNGGLRGFFVGNGLNVLKVFPESAIKFGGFEAAKRMFAALEGKDDPASISRLAVFLAGGMGGMCSQLCVYPLDTLKFRVQCESFNTNLKGRHLVFHTLSSMWNDGGFKLFYRGIGVGVLGIFPFAALDLGIFSILKSTYISRQAAKLDTSPGDVHIGNFAVLSMGAISGSIGASVVYPINLVRTRIQTQGTTSHPYYYTGFLDCYRKTKLREGWRGFFRGLGPNLAKVAPSVSISYLMYENAKRFMGLQ